VCFLCAADRGTAKRLSVLGAKLGSAGKLVAGAALDRTRGDVASLGKALGSAVGSAADKTRVVASEKRVSILGAMPSSLMRTSSAEVQAASGAEGAAESAALSKFGRRLSSKLSLGVLSDAKGTAEPLTKLVKSVKAEARCLKDALQHAQSDAKCTHTRTRSAASAR
jgi:hypothetical protein